MPQIRPISDLRNTTEISELCHAGAEPVFITKNGYGDLVVMSIENYERQQAMLELYKKLGEAEANLAADAELLDASDVFGELRAKYAGK
ncbi:MAG: type II toxin-antitoxin system Phd/YefM family antitoxin [Acidobacteriota bacterium]|jgi:prevent-host-death family protein|nr:type II toxin-antitoxin system Phd/YefM family antitoxin [Acidobacteriota bacterium]